MFKETKIIRCSIILYYLWLKYEWMSFKYIIVILLLYSSISAFSQKKFDFKGEASANISYSPKNDLDAFVGVRYIPEASYTINISESKLLDFAVSANIYASSLFHPFSKSKETARIKPYRAWIRYTGEQFELRLGLQKLNFGSASIIRPLQWFDDMDARDPLKFTTGVYGLMGRYYFLNNANIWAWALYGNENARSFEIIKNNKNIPEYGGRVQLPVPRGEIAFTYHHRTADSRDISIMASYEKVSEDRYALDGKWDVEIGLWFEATYSHKSKNVGLLTNKILLNIGIDYTFPIGSGLNVVAEHLFSDINERVSSYFKNTSHVSVSTISYPIDFSDTISTVTYYSWESKDFTLFLNYQHQFESSIAYVMMYYNPENQLSYFNVNRFSGLGIRFMLVFNH